MIDDVLGPHLNVLFCGINPGLMSEATGHHFARPGNRFWPALHLSGFTPRLLAPAEQHLLPSYGLGITNLVPRPSAKAAELSRAELAEGGVRLAALLSEHRPRTLAVLGVSAFRTAFAVPKATIGAQERKIADTPVWVLPNPSGLNAHWTLDAIAAELRRLRESLTPGGEPGASA